MAAEGGVEGSRKEARCSSGGQYKVNDALEEVDRDLREEEERLLKAKELILKEIRVLNVMSTPSPPLHLIKMLSTLQAEEVTLQRLLQTHIQQPCTQTAEKPAADVPSLSDSHTSPTALPQINLDVGRSRQR